MTNQDNGQTPWGPPSAEAIFAPPTLSGGEAVEPTNGAVLPIDAAPDLGFREVLAQRRLIEELAEAEALERKQARDAVVDPLVATMLQHTAEAAQVLIDVGAEPMWEVNNAGKWVGSYLRRQYLEDKQYWPIRMRDIMPTGESDSKPIAKEVLAFDNNGRVAVFHYEAGSNVPTPDKHRFPTKEQLVPEVATGPNAHILTALGYSENMQADANAILTNWREDLATQVLKYLPKQLPPPPAPLPPPQVR